VTAEYNHGISGFVSYGGDALGTRAVEQLRLVMAELQVATVRNQAQLCSQTMRTLAYSSLTIPRTIGKCHARPDYTS